MSLADSIQVAFEALLANKLRASLTMLGIVIGVGAVIALMAVGQGSQKAVTERIQGLGSNLIFVRPGSQNQGGGVRGGIGTAQTLSLEDARAIQSEVPGVVAAAPQANAGAQVIAGGTNTFARIAGVTPEYADALNLRLASGVFISNEDVDRNARVAVLGANIAQQLFGAGTDPVGQTLRLNVGRNVVTLQIIGLLEPKGGNVQASQDDQVFLPLTTVVRQVSVQRGGQSQVLVSQITVQVANKNQIDGVKQAMDALLRERHRVVEPDFFIESQEDIQAAINQVSATMTVLLGCISGISLVVGGIGIMNIMLVSVTERTREIGIRKAVGARRADILTQFLTEALTVTMIGGLLGIAAGVGAAEFMNGKDIAGLGNNVQTVVSWTSVAVAFVVSAAIGIFFGLYPAQRASRLRPIEALRYE